jgi:hypothetical protein
MVADVQATLAALFPISIFVVGGIFYFLVLGAVSNSVKVPDESTAHIFSTSMVRLMACSSAASIAAYLAVLKTFDIFGCLKCGVCWLMFLLIEFGIVFIIVNV